MQEYAKKCPMKLNSMVLEGAELPTEVTGFFAFSYLRSGNLGSLSGTGKAEGLATLVRSRFWTLTTNLQFVTHNRVSNSRAFNALLVRRYSVPIPGHRLRAFRSQMWGDTSSKWTIVNKDKAIDLTSQHSGVGEHG